MANNIRYWATIIILCGLTPITGQVSAAQADAPPPEVDVLEEIVVRGQPVNETRQVNVGAIGEWGLMDIPLSSSGCGAQ